MTSNQQISEFFTAGGTLPPNAPSYVKRPTDDELFRHIMAGEFCYVLTAREMGKSSLMIRTAQRLSSEGVKSAIVDLTQIGTVELEDQWYKGILTQIARRLKLTSDPVTWWEKRQDIPNLQKFIEFFEEVLNQREDQIVIFIDEIDTTLELNFRDNFFAGIQAMYNARAENPNFKRVTFVLLGVASPSDLIKDGTRTPFNIGKEFILRPFSRKDVILLEKGLEEMYPGFGSKLLDRIFYWTEGNPYFTQKLCQSLVELRFDKCEDEEIDQMVEKLFISEEARREPSLKYVHDIILSYPARTAILSLYKKLLHKDEVVENNSLPLQNQLLLSGLARVEKGKLIISNKIYGKVFDLNWVNKYVDSYIDFFSNEFFIAGGTLPPDAPSYVKRPADDELFRHVMAREFCYILTSRQMGKSSLMIRTAQRLQSEGVKSAIVDLTQTGTVDSEDQWYKGILTQIKRRLRLGLDPVNWWEQKRDIPNIQKFIEFFQEVLSKTKEPIVIFIDEIDTTIKLNFRDDFFAGIRALFNARAEYPDLKQITFVLFGVASPSDLIKDRNRTPFNIGQAILLKPFSRTDARTLEKGLEAAYSQSDRKILDRIFYWTNGHPYLTQKLCQSVVENRLEKADDIEIDALVKNLFTSEEASREANLQFVRDNILSYPERRVILSLYKRILRGTEVRDNQYSLPQNHLKLSGLALVENGKLIISNKIYSSVFNLRWANNYTEFDWRSVIIPILMFIIISFASVIYSDGIRLPLQAETRIAGVPIYRDDRGIQYLADLFQMQPLILSNEYEYKAKDTFFNGLDSWEDQKALIEIANGEPHPSPEDYKIVIVGLYTSLADVENSGQTTQLLAVMHNSLIEMGMQDEDVYQEIGYWLKARQNANENNFQDALNNYNNAINLNPQNPATLFERARIYTKLGDYENALRNYEQVIAVVPQSDIEPTEASTSVANIGTIATIPTLFTPTMTATYSTEMSSEAIVTSTLSQLSPTPLLEPISTQVSTITPIPPLPIQPRFLTRGQRVAAVRNDIYQNGDLYLSYFQFGQVDFPNLAANVPALTPTTSPTETLMLTPTQATLGTGYINKPIASAWGEPNSQFIGTLSLNQSLTLLERREVAGSIWYRCTWENDGMILEGWILADNITSRPPAPVIPTFLGSSLPSQTDVFSPGCFLIEDARVFAQFHQGQAGISAELVSSGRTSRGLRLDFSNASNEGANYAGWEMWLGENDQSGIDLSSYNSLVFYIKGAVGGEEPNVYLMMPIIDMNLQRYWKDVELVTPITTSWQRVEIPLSHFASSQIPGEQVDLSNVQRIQILFEWYAQSTSGRIFIDDLCVE